MLKTLLKRMWNYIDEHLIQYSVLIVILAGLLTIGGGIVQQRKDLKQARKDSTDAAEALDAEKRRVSEHDSLQRRSNEILESIEKVLGETEELLRKADTTIAGQADIIDKQSLTIKEIRGGDEIPRLIITLNSFTDLQYKVFFSISNEDNFSSHGVKLHIDWINIDYDSEIISLRTQMKAIRDYRAREVDEKRRLNSVEFGPISIGARNKYDFHVSDAEFYDPTKYFTIKVTWNKGSYTAKCKLLTEPIIPSLLLTDVLDDKNQPVPLPEEFCKITVGNFESGKLKRYEKLEKIRLEKQNPHNKR